MVMVMGIQMPSNITLDYTPQARQQILHNTKARQILYGGAGLLTDKIATPTGWTTYNDVYVGQSICHPSGRTQIITEVHEIFQDDGIRLHFDDNTSVVVSKEHLWKVWTAGSRIEKRKETMVKGKITRQYNVGKTLYGQDAAKVKDTNHVMQLIDKANVKEISGNRKREYPLTPVTDAVGMTEQPIPIDPYLLGTLLGDGSFSKKAIVIYCHSDDYKHQLQYFSDHEVSLDFSPDRPNVTVIRFRDPDRKNLLTSLEALGLKGKIGQEKFVPDCYLWNTRAVRLSILQGLMDTDGTVDHSGHPTFVNISQHLAEAVAFLARSLGGTATVWTENIPTSWLNDEGIRYNVYINLHDTEVFRLKRKQDLIQIKHKNQSNRINKYEIVPNVHMRCITVSELDGLYITNGFKVTHNSAGGGKSHSLRWDAIAFCLQNPGLQAYLFRRTYNELEDNHINPIQQELPPEVGTYYPSKGFMEFPNKSRLHFCHCENTGDYKKYMGAEFHWLGIDEASLMEPIQIIELRGRLRLGGYQKKVVDKEFLPRCVLTSNPGGPSHNFLKRIFMDNHIPEKEFFDPTTKDIRDPEDKGWLSIFIPARMSDNKFLDKGYGSAFSAMAPERARALRDGDWDAVEGAALHTLTKQKHCLKQFELPKSWLKFVSMDWGTAKPYSVGYYTVVPDNIVVRDNRFLDNNPKNPYKDIVVPKGSIIRFDEIYGWNGEEDTGVRLDSGAVARQIMDYNSRRGYIIDYYTGDSAMYAQHDGPSPAERMFEVSEQEIQIRIHKKDRESSYNEILARLAGNPYVLQNGKQEEHPTLFFSENCVHAWRTLPVLTIDPSNPDKGPGERQEDHLYDELCYSLNSRPYIMTADDRHEAEIWERKKAYRKSGDPYQC